MKRPLCFICLAFVLTLYCYMEWNPLPVFECESYAGRRIQMTGQIEQKEKKNQQMVLYLNHVTFCDKDKFPKQKQQTIEYRFICYFEEGTVALDELKIGRTVCIEGKMKPFSKATNPGEFDAATYYHVLGYDGMLEHCKAISASITFDTRKEFLYQCKEYLAKRYEQYLPEKEASIMKAMVLGDKGELDHDSKDLYRRAGISHILAISGLHITLLGMALYGLLRKCKIPIVLAALGSIFIMIQYGDMTGMSSSAYRAIFMFGCRLISKCIKRSYDMLTAMLISSMLLLLDQPMYIYHSGFLLSFGAILGIGLMNPVFCSKSKRKKYFLQRQLQKTISSFQGSIAIFSIHFPILLSQYYVFPMMSFLLNILVIPMMGIVLALGIFLLIIGIIIPPLASLLAICLEICLWIFEVCAKKSVMIPGAIWTVGMPETWQIIIYIVVIVCLVLTAEKLPLWLRYAWLLAAVLVLAMPWQIHSEITMIDVGQGDSIFIATSSGHHYLIDGGSTSKKNLAKYQMIPFLHYQGVDVIDGIFITHLDDDHISGIKDLLIMQREENIEIKGIVLAQAVIHDEAYDSFVQLCGQQKVPIYYMQKGNVIKDHNMTISCLYPAAEYNTNNRNAASLVLDVSIDYFNGLFTGDVDEEGEKAIARYLKEYSPDKTYEVFKVTHHGSKFSNIEALLQQIMPEVSLISSGVKNQYGHPHQETLKRLQDLESKIYQTQEYGAIKVMIMKDGFKVETFRKN